MYQAGQRPERLLVLVPAPPEPAPTLDAASYGKGVRDGFEAVARILDQLDSSALRDLAQRLRRGEVTVKP